MKFYYCNHTRNIAQFPEMLAMGSPGSSSLICQLGTLGRRIVSVLCWNVVVLVLAQTENLNCVCS